jgi:hypothetical protein
LPEWHDSLSLNFYRNGETGNLHVGTAHPVKCVCGGVVQQVACLGCLMILKYRPVCLIPDAIF